MLAPDCIGAEVERMVRDEINIESSCSKIYASIKKKKKTTRHFLRRLASLAMFMSMMPSAPHIEPTRRSPEWPRFLRTRRPGLLMQKELDYFSPILSDPEKPFVTILGGAKVSDKIGVIKNLLPKVDALLIGGGMAYTFLKAQGIEIGKSLLEQDKIGVAADILKEAAVRGVKFFCRLITSPATREKKQPSTCDKSIPPDRMGLDIGPKRSRYFPEKSAAAKTGALERSCRFIRSTPL